MSDYKIPRVYLAIGVTGWSFGYKSPYSISGNRRSKVADNMSIVVGTPQQENIRKLIFST